MNQCLGTGRYCKIYIIIDLYSKTDWQSRKKKKNSLYWRGKYSLFIFFVRFLPKISKMMHEFSEFDPPDEAISWLHIRFAEKKKKENFFFLLRKVLRLQKSWLILPQYNSQLTFPGLHVLSSKNGSVCLFISFKSYFFFLI